MIIDMKYHENIYLSWQSTEYHIDNYDNMKFLQIKLATARKLSIILIISPLCRSVKPIEWVESTENTHANRGFFWMCLY